MESTLASQYSEWIERLTFDQLPPAVVEAAKGAVRDSIANSVLGASLSWMEPYRRLAAVSFAPGDSTVALSRKTFSLRDAIFLNAVYCHACEFDDIMSGHPGAVVISTALALGEQRHLSGRDILAAVVAGYEIMYRSTAAIHPGEVRKGFNGTGLAGPFGATTAAGKLLGLSAAQLTHALGIAGNYSCGLMEYDLTGGECKRLYAGMSARAGLEAASLAQFGLTGPPSVFEGKKGVFKTFGMDIDLSKSEAGLGTEYRIVRRWCKAYPSVGTAHGAIDAMEALCAQHDIDPPAVKQVTVAAPHMTVLHGGGIRVPWDLMSAQFSLAFSVAIRAIFRSNKIGLYSDPKVWSDPRVVSFIEKVEVVEDKETPGGADGQVTMTIELTNGSSVRHVQKAPRGAARNPLSQQELVAKYRECTEGVLAASAADELDKKIAHLESVPDVAPLVGLLAKRA